MKPAREELAGEPADERRLAGAAGGDVADGEDGAARAPDGQEAAPVGGEARGDARAVEGGERIESVHAGALPSKSSRAAAAARAAAPEEAEKRAAAAADRAGAGRASRRGAARAPRPRSAASAAGKTAPPAASTVSRMFSTDGPTTTGAPARSGSRTLCPPFGANVPPRSAASAERVRPRQLADRVEEEDVGAGLRRPVGERAPPHDVEAGLPCEPLRRVEVVGLARREDEEDAAPFRRGGGARRGRAESRRPPRSPRRGPAVPPRGRAPPPRRTAAPARGGRTSGRRTAVTRAAGTPISTKRAASGGRARENARERAREGPRREPTRGGSARPSAPRGARSRGGPGPCGGAPRSARRARARSPRGRGAAGARRRRSAARRTGGRAETAATGWRWTRAAGRGGRRPRASSR